MGTATLKLNGRPLLLNADTPSIARVREYLESLPPNELKTSNDLLKACQVGRATLQRAAHDLPDNQQRTYIPHNTTYWASRKTIAELRKQLRQRGQD